MPFLDVKAMVIRGGDVLRLRARQRPHKEYDFSSASRSRSGTFFFKI